MAGKKPIFTRQDMLSLLFAVAASALAMALLSRVEMLRHMGYAGVFIISLLSSATIFLPLPGFAVVFAMGAFLDPVLVGIAAGMGSGIGEMTGYFAGYAGHDAVKGTRLFRDHEKWLARYGPLAVFALAFVPNPAFDAAGMAAGAIEMPAWKFLLATVAGKTLRFALLAYAGGMSYGLWQWA